MSPTADGGDDRVLAGRVVIVTGAGRGCGRAYAHHAARAGARVVVNDVDGDEAKAVVAAIEAARGTAVASTDDVSTADGAESLIATANEAFGRLDGLVNNAGRYYESTPWDDEPERIARLIAVNVMGTMLCTMWAARTFRAQRRGGAIVNASSGGLFGFPHTSAYAASKGAIASATYSGALDLEQIGVRVNAISPMALTRMTEGALGRSLTPAGSAHTPLEGIEEMAPERIAPLVTFLLSERAEGITGQFLRFNGTRLSVVRQYAFADHPSVLRERGWDVPAFDEVFAAGRLAGALEPYGVERRATPESEKLIVLAFDGRVVVVTGGAGSLGRAYALGFASRGARVVVNDLGVTPDGRAAAEQSAAAVVEEIRRAGGTAVGHAGSVADPGTGDELVRTALEAFGRVDAIVNNAGIARTNDFDVVDLADVEEILRVHVMGAFALNQAAWAAFREQGNGGSIINTVSSVGLFGQPRSSGYATAKMGLVGQMRVLAQEGARIGVRVNAVAPVAASAMSAGVYRELNPELTPERVAAVVVALSHPSCALTGEVVSAGGGRISRIVIATEQGSFDSELDPELAAGRLAAWDAEGAPGGGRVDGELTRPGSALGEIDLIRQAYPRLTEPLRYEWPARAGH